MLNLDTTITTTTTTTTTTVRTTTRTTIDKNKENFSSSSTNNNNNNNNNNLKKNIDNDDDEILESDYIEKKKKEIFDKNHQSSEKKKKEKKKKSNNLNSNSDNNRVQSVDAGTAAVGVGVGVGVGVSSAADFDSRINFDRELTTEIVPVPMSPRLNNSQTKGIGAVDEILLHPKGGGRLKNNEKQEEEEEEEEGKEGKGKEEKENQNQNGNNITQIRKTNPNDLHLNSSMESLSGSGYIISVSLVLVVGAIVGVLATVSHHFHRRYQRRLPDAPEATDATEELPSNTENRYQATPPTRRRHHSATPMLSVSGGMEVGSGGRSGRNTIGSNLQGGGGGGGGVGGGRPASENENEIVAATRDRAVRASSVRQDLALDLPPRLQLPDGEERPYGAHAGLHLRDPEQESEIYQKCVRPPPNRTVFDSESPPAYRSQSALLDTPTDRIVRCHSAGSSLLKVFRKFPTSGSSTPSVIVPRRPTLSSYSESSSNLSNLSSLTVVPCETDDTQNHV